MDTAILLFRMGHMSLFCTTVLVVMVVIFVVIQGVMLSSGDLRLYRTSSPWCNVLISGDLSFGTMDASAEFRYTIRAVSRGSLSSWTLYSSDNATKLPPQCSFLADELSSGENFDQVEVDLVKFGLQWTFAIALLALGRATAALNMAGTLQKWPALQDATGLLGNTFVIHTLTAWGCCCSISDDVEAAVSKIVQDSMRYIICGYISWMLIDPITTLSIHDDIPTLLVSTENSKIRATMLVSGYVILVLVLLTWGLSTQQSDRECCGVNIIPCLGGVLCTLALMMGIVVIAVKVESILKNWMLVFGFDIGLLLNFKVQSSLAALAAFIRIVVGLIMSVDLAGLVVLVGSAIKMRFAVEGSAVPASTIGKRGSNRN